MKNYQIVILLIISSFSVSAQVTNSSFENWTAVANYSEPIVFPANFSSVNDQSFHLDSYLGMKEVPHGVDGSAIHLETYNHTGDTLTGYGIFGNLPLGDSLVFSEGFPFTDINVSGVRMDLRYDINELSPGFFLVQFLAEGIPVTTGPNHNGTYLFPISGIQNEWTTVSFDFFPLLTQIPEECVIAFGSNDLFGGNESYVVDWLEIDNIEFEGTTQSEVPGGGFDSWENKTIETIDNWDSYLPPFIDFISPVEESYSGELAIQLETIDFEGGGRQAMMYQAEYTDAGFLPNQLLEPTSYAVEFYYQFTSPAPAEKAIVYLLLSDEPNPATEDVFFVSSNIEQTDNWVYKNIDFHQIMPNANYYGLVFFSGNGLDEAGVVGSQLLLDDVAFLTIIQDCDFTPSIISTADTICTGEELTLTTQVYENFQWFASEGENDDFSIVNLTPSYNFNDAEAGIYNLFMEQWMDVQQHQIPLQWL